MLPKEIHQGLVVREDKELSAIEVSMEMLHSVDDHECFSVDLSVVPFSWHQCSRHIPDRTLRAIP